MPDNQIILPEPQTLRASLSSHFRLLTPRIESFAKVSAFLGIACYVLGLLVVNLDIGQYGVTDFQVVKPECVFVGMWSLLLMCASAVPCSAALWYVIEQPKRRFTVVLGAVVAFVCAWVVVCGLVHGLLRFVPTYFGDEPNGSFLFRPLGWLHLLATTTLCGLIASGFVFVDIGRYGGMKALRRNAFPVVTILLISMVPNIQTVAHRIYSRVGPEVGGGHPIPIVAQFNKDGAETLALIESLTKDATGHYCAVCKDHPNLLGGELVYRAADVYVIRVGFCALNGNKWFVDQRSFVIDKRLISLVSPRPNMGEYIPFNCEKFPLPQNASKDSTQH